MTTPKRMNSETVIVYLNKTCKMLLLVFNARYIGSDIAKKYISRVSGLS